MPTDIPREVDILGREPNTPAQAQRRATATERALELIESFKPRLDWELGDRWDDVVQRVMATLVEKSRNRPMGSSDWAIYKNNDVARSYIWKMTRNTVIDVLREERPDDEIPDYLGAPGENEEDEARSPLPDPDELTPEETAIDRRALDRWQRAFDIFFETLVPTVAESLGREDWIRAHYEAVEEMVQLRTGETTIDEIVEHNADPDESFTTVKARVHKRHQRTRDRHEELLAELPSTPYWEEWELDTRAWGRLWGLALWMRQKTPSDLDEIVPDDALGALESCQRPAFESV
jgi:DNA-directed RNA polymerase specialized sigma24 family protein